MKQNIKYILLSLLVLLMVSCQKSQEYYEGLYVVGADQLSPVANLTIDDLPAAVSYTHLDVYKRQLLGL